MPEKKIQILLSLNADKGLDDEQMERVTRQLRFELLGLDVDDVELVKSGAAPTGAKAGDTIAWGTLLMTLAASGGVLTTIIGTLQSWLTRHNQRSISLEINGSKIDIKGISSEDQRRLINEWISSVQGKKR